MEARRIEGVFLDASILRNRAQEAYRVSRTMEIRVLSRVPEAFMSSLGDPGSRFTALVREVTPERVVLTTDNGYEIHAENRLSQPVREGERLTILVESKNPFVLKVESSSMSVGVRDVWRSLLREGISFIRLIPDRIRESIERSGLIYERRVWEFLRGNIGKGDLQKDAKFLVLRRLQGTDTSDLEEILRTHRLPQDLKERVENLLRVAQSGDRVSFLLGVRSLSSEIAYRVYVLESEIGNLTSAVGERVTPLVGKILEALRSMGVKADLNQNTLSSIAQNPKSLDIIRSVLESLRINRWGEAVEKFRILGIEIRTPDAIPLVRDGLVRHITPLVQGAVQGLLEDTGQEDLRTLMESLKEKQEDLSSLRSFRDSVEANIPRGVKENLHRLDVIGYIQSYFVSKEGRKFFVPFRTEDGRGVLVFSMENAFRILVKIEYKEGFIGVVMEAPRRKDPTCINLTFVTDIEGLDSEIERRQEDLKEDLKEVGLELRRFEVKVLEREKFEETMMEDLGDDVTFTMRV